jgi:hypothetical protein
VLPLANTGGANCYAAGGAVKRDLTAGYTGTGFATPFTGSDTSAQVIAFCSPVLAAGTVVSGSTPIAALLSNSLNSAGSNCTVTWSLLRNAGGTPLATGSVVVPRRTASQTLSVAPTITAFTAAAGDQISLVFSFATSNCSGTTLSYGGQASLYGPPSPGTLDLTTGTPTTSSWPTPNAPTGLTAAAAPGGGTLLTWTPPSGAVSFYRIYRDGTDYGTYVLTAQRYDTCDTSCQVGSTFQYTDAKTDGVAHTYRVTAVGATTGTPSMPSMAESAFSSAVTR